MIRPSIIVFSFKALFTYPKANPDIIPDTGTAIIYILTSTSMPFESVAMLGNLTLTATMFIIITAAKNI